MTNDFFAPVDSVSRDDRERAGQQLREAHRLGHLDDAEFEARMSRVIAADRLAELSAAVDGPAPHSESWQQHRPYREPSFGAAAVAGVVQPARQAASSSTTMALVAHLAPFLTWLIGPLVLWAIAAKGSYARREAAKAFNWQLTAFVIGIVVSVLGGLLPGDGNPIAGLWTAAWVVLTVIGAVMAHRGADWRNPVRALVPWEVLPERERC